MQDSRDACRHAISCEERGKLDEAIAAYTEAIKLDAQWSDVYVFRGHVYLKKGEFDLAIRDFGEAIRLDAKDADAYTMRALAHQRKGETERAEADYAKSEQLGTHRG
jgi:tetratricopeptide (TPR) repeat protein